MRKTLPVLFMVLALTAISAPIFADEATTSPSGVVNINTADASQLSLLPRVGAKAAQRVVEYRTEHGPFKKTTDLMQVKGFGDKTFEGLSAYITIEGKTTLSEKIKSPRKPHASKASKSHQSTAG
jgi:competence protein ComEA